MKQDRVKIAEMKGTWRVLVNKADFDV
jgi:hypothetical protein